MHERNKKVRFQIPVDLNFRLSCPHTCLERLLLWLILAVENIEQCEYTAPRGFYDREECKDGHGTTGCIPYRRRRDESSPPVAECRKERRSEGDRQALRALSSADL